MHEGLSYLVTSMLNALRFLLRYSFRGREQSLLYVMNAET